MKPHVHASARPSGVKRLLILVFSPAEASFDDFLDIAREVSKLSPETAITIVTPRDTYDAIPPADRQLPTLTVGIGTRLGKFIPARGAIREAMPVSKLDQFERFGALGIATPVTRRFEPGNRYDEREWGEFVVLKPLALRQTSTGLGVKLIRTRRLGEITSAAALRHLMGIEGPMLIQQFVDTDVYPTNWRILTLFGRPLYSMKFRCPVERPNLAASDADIEQAIIETKHPDLKTRFKLEELRELTSEPHILQFATRVAQAYPRTPILGVDVLENVATGELYALEINGGGKVWHFSSPRGQIGRSAGMTREKRVAQFGAWKVAAEALVSELAYAS